MKMQQKYAPVPKKQNPTSYIIGISIVLVAVIIGVVAYFLHQQTERLKLAEKTYKGIIQYEKNHPLDFKTLLTKIDESKSKVNETPYESKLQDKELNINSKQDILTKIDEVGQRFDKFPSDYDKTMKEYTQLKKVAQKLKSSQALTIELEHRINDLKQYQEKYAIVVSEKTSKDQKWLDVVNALREKHEAKYKVKVFTYKDNLKSLKPDLAKFAPKYICFVATPEEAGRGGGQKLADSLMNGNPATGFVPEVYQLTRELDDDPYGDAIWAILTGYEPEDALRIAKHNQPLRVKKALSAKAGYIQWFKEAQAYSELKQGVGYIKKPDEPMTECKVPDDTTKCLIDSLNSNTYDFFDTCGHATEHVWMIGFKFESGVITHKDGQLYGFDLQKNKYKINTDNPKIYYGEGNCLIGHIDQRDCMATSWIHSGGAYHMCGYIVPTWWAIMGWDVFWHFVASGDCFTFAEAFFITNQTVVMGLEEKLPEVMDNPKCKRVYGYDKDVVALYGDPAWDARMDKEDNYLFQPNLSYTYKGNGKYEFVFKITSKQDGLIFTPTPGGGGTCAGALLPFRVTNMKDITTDCGGKIVVTENFVLMQVKDSLKKGDERKVTFTAEILKPVGEP
jgi:zinc protease